MSEWYRISRRRQIRTVSQIERYRALKMAERTPVADHIAIERERRKKAQKRPATPKRD